MFLFFYLSLRFPTPLFDTMNEMKYVSYLLVLTVLFVFVSETHQASGTRLSIYEDSSCTKYLAESHMTYQDPNCTPFTCAPYDGRYAKLECNTDLTDYPRDQTLGVGLYDDSNCNSSLLFRYLVTPNATGMCFISAQGYYFIATTNDCPTRTVVDVYQFKVSGVCKTLDRHWDGNVGQCTLGMSYYADAICPVEPVPITPPVSEPIAAPLDAPMVAPVTVPVDAPISEPVTSEQPVKAPKPRLSSGSFVPVFFSLALLFSIAAL